MLRELRISNFAIIDELHLRFEPGLNVLTGETGAGKSIIMRSVGLLCGERAVADLIRTQADEAEIEGVFDVAAGEHRALQDSGLPASDELLIRRVISRSGKGRAYVNGSLATSAMLSQLGQRLIHVYGQHEHALLLKPESHLSFIDDFGALAAVRERMAEEYAAFHAAAERVSTLVATGDAARQRVELLRFQVTELVEAHVAPGEETQLQQEREFQRHAEKLAGICQQAEQALYSSDEALSSGVARVIAQLHEAARIDPQFLPQIHGLQQAVAQIDDAALELRRAGERIRHDPERLDEIESRLALINRLKRKYGCEADELSDRLRQFEVDLSALESASMDVSTARQEALKHAGQAWTVARELSRLRQAAARKLEKKMAEELRTLAIRGATFRVVFTVAGSDGPQSGSSDPVNSATSALSARGADVVEFYLSANVGEDPKPLARIASGGELSRIMLALKALTAGAGEVPTLIFDEVDAGIGGAVAEAVGKRLRVLGRSRQVLCITHLPHIAALADHHFAVEKHVSKGRTTATARALAKDERVDELTRMLGGTSTESQRYARRLMTAIDDAGPD